MIFVDPRKHIVDTREIGGFLPLSVGFKNRVLVFGTGIRRFESSRPSQLGQAEARSAARASASESSFLAGAAGNRLCRVRAFPRQEPGTMMQSIYERHRNSSSHSATERANLEICTRMYHDMLFKFDARLIDRYIAADYVQHSTAASNGREGLRAFFENRADAFPDVRMRIMAQFADGDFTIFHIHTVRHADDPGMSIIDIFRMEDGMVREHWEVVQEIPTSIPHDNGIF
jgi:predicted SnoaL-like aldol condensation-catalyzing enzyme